MLREVRMQNWKQHVERTIKFTPGVNGIRAPNGSGKSNTLLACRYALYGAKALTEALEDVVTYDTPVSKLKVELDLDFAGVDYHVTRSKSGAELTFGSERVTGQNEVTKFFENLFGASQDLAAKLMFAKQKAVGGALDDGPTAASQLIESLADLDLIERLVGLVGEHLPAGNTDVQKATVSTLREQAAPAEPVDLAPLQEENARAVAAMETANGAYKAKKAELDNLDLAAAREILSDEKVLLATIAACRTNQERAQAVLALPELPAPADDEIEALRGRIAAQKDLEAAGKLHAELKLAPTSEMWDNDLASLQVEVTETAAAAESLAAQVRLHRDTLQKVTQALASAESQYQVKRAGIEGRLIKDTTCALCQKDLKDVPEVARINSPLNQQLIDLEAAHETNLAGLLADKQAESLALSQAETSTAEKSAYLRDLQAVVKANDKLAGLYGRAAKYITLDESVVPAQWTWTGPTGAPQNLDGDLQRMVEQQRASVERTAKRGAAAAEAERLEGEIQAATEKTAGLQLVDARETLELEVALKPQVQALLEVAQAAERTLAARRVEFDQARAENERRATAAAAAQGMLAAAEAVLVEMEANNVLVKKLRAARPQITDKLWAMVLGAASTYYSDMRGDRFVFTRVDGKFRVNGKPTSGMSGAEADILGLAIRMALTRMFLPSVDFLVLDEVAAACDDEREALILGLLSTIGFGQIILVTHSAAVESIADNIINID